MDIDLAQNAISEALHGDWEEAIKTNLLILKNSSDDTEALNRLARAYTEVGEIEKAKAIASKVLKIDPVNSIAKKSLEKWKTLKNTDRSSPQEISSDNFLEEPGKTKIVSLLHTGDEECLAKLNPGDQVKLLTHPHRVSVVTMDGKYIGRVSDDLSARLRRSIKLGNEYQVLVTTVEGRDVKVFIRGSVQTFPTEKIEYTSFTPPELVHKEVPITTLEENSENSSD